MKKKTIFLVAMATLCIAAAVLAPIITFLGVDSATWRKNFPIESAPGGIEVSSSDIPLVANIHQILLHSYETEASISPSSFESMYRAMAVLLESGVLPQEIETLLVDTYHSAMSEDADCYLEESEQAYSITYFGVGNSTISECRCTVELDTGKIISFYLYCTDEENPYYIADQTPDREQAMKRYIKYLGLDVLEDWVYNGNRYYSEKAGLYVNMEYQADTGYFYIGMEGQ